MTVSHTDTVKIDWLTVAAFAALALALTTTFHEGTHAVVCLLLGGELKEFSALHVLCHADAVWQEKMVAGSASLVNIVIGTVCLLCCAAPAAGRLKHSIFSGSLC